MNTLQVLIIEDDRDAARFFKTVLELTGFVCEICLTAKEALDRLAVCAPELILLDIRLGIEISGEDILYQIRSNPRFDKTRVAVITAYPWLAEPITNLADLVLVKPIEIDQLNCLMQRLGSLEGKPKFQMYRDPVTELFNEEFFLTRLDLAIERAKRLPAYHFGVISTDVHLETKADEPVGPDVTLAILREVAGRLKRFVRSTDAVARLAGWKFATLHEDLNDPEEIHGIVRWLSGKLVNSYEVGGTYYTVSFYFLPIVQSLQCQSAADILNAARKGAGSEIRSKDKILIQDGASYD